MALAVDPWTAARPVPAPPPVLDVVVPVFNEERDLAPSVARLHRYLSGEFPFTFRITIADNASTDDTAVIGRALAVSLDHVDYVRIEERGRGRALRAAWERSDATVLAYTDVDLSTDLAALLPLVAPLLSGHSDVAIGSRLARGSRVVRGPKREVVSRCYNLLLRGTMATGFTDAQCGFKAIRGDVAKALLPLIEDTGWFFDTELLVLAQRSGLRVHEVPVDWVDDPDSRVRIVPTAIADLRGVARLGRGLFTGRISTESVRDRFGRPALPQGVLGAERAPSRMLRARTSFAAQLGWFVAVGIASTIAYAALFLALRHWYPAQTANLVALLLTAVANTAANRRMTFGITGSANVLRQHVQALAVFLVAVATTSAALALLAHLHAAPSRWAEVAVLIVANALVTLLRFLALRLWVFGTRRVGPEVVAA